ncbi:hypothetical protein B0T26DRAFT_632795 [Lasiosphaeria miniovina]|uniref:Secreted protein n=1 Tax=Lasiosphaeria miniovina TaxID=1954250 RepID=A0AA40EEH7_9PEZI|nr:uncharacterized protein B0T26DRAFT_632795 [Lasiosphaeria miniovina]KAK0734526.1 hypothetical protein B0T26DRAFT_632795 [Lasiosphaeria miniovina]
MGPLSHLALLLAAVYPALAAADTPSSSPRITSISWSGNGCPRDPKFDGDFNAPVFTYNNFAASLPGTNQTLNCEVHIQTAGTSPGWQVALKNNWVKGHLVLSPGTTLDYYTTVYFSQSASNTASLRGRWTNGGDGTIDQGVTLRQTFSGQVWSPCTGDGGSIGILNVNFRGALNGDGKAYFEAFTEKLDFEWRRC